MATIIPFVKDKKKRDEMKKEYDKTYFYAADANIKRHLDSINQKMADLREMARLSEEESLRLSLQVPPPPPPTEWSGTDASSPAGILNEKELEKEYRRKKDEAAKRRQDANKKVVRDYDLLGPRGRGK